MTGMVAELKIGEADNAAVLECFRNMSATGATIALQHLVDGYVVDRVVVYSIVVGITTLKQAQLLKLEMDFKEGNCSFALCSRRFEFDLILNVVVSYL